MKCKNCKVEMLEARKPLICFPEFARHYGLPCLYCCPKCGREVEAWRKTDKVYVRNCV